MTDRILREIINDFDDLALKYLEWPEHDSPYSRKRDPYYEDARKCALWRESGWNLNLVPEFNDELLNRRARDLKPKEERTVPLPIRDIQKLTGFGETKFRQMMEAGELGLKKIDGTKTVTLWQSEYEKLKANS